LEQSLQNGQGADTLLHLPPLQYKPKQQSPSVAQKSLAWPQLGGGGGGGVGVGLGAGQSRLQWLHS
jgi:hypothetical protein